MSFAPDASVELQSEGILQRPHFHQDKLKATRTDFKERRMTINFLYPRPTIFPSIITRCSRYPNCIFKLTIYSGMAKLQAPERITTTPLIKKRNRNPTKNHRCKPPTKRKTPPSPRNNRIPPAPNHKGSPRIHQETQSSSPPCMPPREDNRHVAHTPSSSTSAKVN